MRALLIYSFFGPYHLARWNYLRATLPARGIIPLALQIFHGSDLYRWTTPPDVQEICDLGLATNGDDNLRWRDTRHLIRALEALRPDLVFVNGWSMRQATISNVWSRLRGVRRVIVSDSQEIDADRTFLKEGMKRWLVQGAGAAFVAGGPQRRYAERLGIPRELIFEGCDVVDNAHFAEARSLRQPGGRRLLTVARWAPEKNLLAAGRAFLRFVAERPAVEEWRWKIAGFGPLTDAIHTMAADSDGRIELLGTRTYADLPATYADADVYWQPSVRDPWGLVVNEAMAAGLPVIVSSRCGCHEDLVTRETGWVFDPHDDKDMVRGLHAAASVHLDWTTMGQAAARLIDAWGLPRFAEGFVQAAHAAATPGWAPAL